MIIKIFKTISISKTVLIALSYTIYPHHKLYPPFKRNFIRMSSSLSISSTQEAIIQHWEGKDGEHKFLEDVNGEEAISWVKTRNQHCMNILGSPADGTSSSHDLYKSILSILDSKDKIPYVAKNGDLYYNFWQDEHHPRGILRRTSYASYITSSPSWEVVIDIDNLGMIEGESWVYKGMTVYQPHDDTPDSSSSPSPSLLSSSSPRRALISLSRGGADASVVREFDIIDLKFVDTADDAFFIPEAKSSYAWVTQDLLLVGTDLHDDKSLTSSGYPRVVREWKRGTRIEDATIIYEGEVTDVSVNGYVSRHGKYEVQFIDRNMTFYTSKKQVKLNHIFYDHHPASSSDIMSSSSSSSLSSSWVELSALPIDAVIGQFQDMFLIELRSSWTISSSSSYAAGSLLSINIMDFIMHQHDISSCIITPLFIPTLTNSLTDNTATRSYLILHVLDDVKERFIFYKYHPSSASSSSYFELVSEQHDGMIQGSSISAIDAHTSDMVWYTSSSFTQPTRLYMIDISSFHIDDLMNMMMNSKDMMTNMMIKSLPDMYDATNIIESQHHATSYDGTIIPYFMIHNKDISYDSNNPVLLYGYGGFEISLLPSYQAMIGYGWLQRGGVFIYANIRGGGEFGPSWHQAALKEHRYHAYDDFICIAEDIISKNITSSSKLCIRGGSNGGMLMGNMMTRRPDLWKAVICAVPLLDMKRYHMLLAGASWMAEYGNPDDMDDWRYLRSYSPYHNIDEMMVKDDKYPLLLMTTSTRDDRVHPYHARAFVKRLLDIHPNDEPSSSSSSEEKEMMKTIMKNRVLYYENMEGGHGGAADNPQQAFMSALYLDFLWKVVGNK